MNKVFSKYSSKDTAGYKAFTNDLQSHRLSQWTSIYFQVAPIVTASDVYSVLEFGSGRNLSKAIVSHYGIKHTSVDAVDTYSLDIVSDIEEFPVGGTKYDLVCSFQCLEHNSWDKSKKLIEKISMHSKKYVYLSLPHSGLYLSFFVNIRLPKLNIQSRQIVLFVKNLFAKRFPDWQKKQEKLVKAGKKNAYSPHYWEIGMKGFPESKLIDFADSIGLELVWKKRNPIFPHHAFFMFRHKYPQNTQKSRV